MPTIRRLIDEGASGPLYSTIPPISPTAWTSFMTGKNPGQHGIYGFAVKPPGSYMLEPFSAKGIPQGQTLWGMLSARGKRVAVINVPMTYPAGPVNGVMISGFGAPSEQATRFVHPPELINELKAELGSYILDLHWAEYADRGLPAVIQDARKITRRRADYGLKILKRENWDLFVTVFVETDRLQHCAWQYLENSGRTLTSEEDHVRSQVLDYYQYLDTVLGEFIAASPDADVLIMSDHGFGPFQATVQVNTWLGQNGFLSWAQENKARYRGVVNILKQLGIKREHFGRLASVLGFDEYRHLEKVSLGMNNIDWHRTRAFSYTPSGIYFNLKGRERQGIVEPGVNAERLFDELKEQLLDLRDPVTMSRVVLQVAHPQEVYRGEMLAQAPDLMVTELSPGYELNFNQRPTPQAFERSNWRSGTHHPEGVLIACGPHIASGKRLSRAVLEDLCPTCLALSGEPVPQNIDGKVLKEILSVSQSDIPAVETYTPEPEAPVPSESLSAEEQQMVYERLKELGYLE
jgi:predicted AlkP superfamily phosphohydrolase/phosphomutase